MFRVSVRSVALLCFSSLLIGCDSRQPLACADPEVKERVTVGFVESSMLTFEQTDVSVDYYGNVITNLSDSTTVAYEFSGGELTMEATNFGGTRPGETATVGIRDVTSISQDETTGTWQCEAEIVLQDGALPVSYTSSLTDEGQVRVSGEIEVPVPGAAMTLSF